MLISRSLPTGAQQATALLGLVVRLVVDIRPAQGAGIEMILVLIRSARYHRTVELSMVFDFDVIPAFTRKQPSLFFDAVKVTLELVLADAYVG